MINTQDSGGRGSLRLLACWDCVFESCRAHGCLSIASFVCCQEEVPATGRTLVRSGPTESMRLRVVVEPRQ